MIPVGVFMLMQVWAHAKALDGPEAHRQALVAVQPSSWATGLLVLAPLAFHAGYGLVLAIRPRYNVGRYPHSRNWTYTLQRVTGVLALVFILFVLGSFWGAPVDRLPEVMLARMSQTHGGLPLVALAHLLGFGTCVFHFAVGLWTIALRYGFASTKSGQTQTGAALGLVGIAMFVWGGHSMIFMATGWRAVPRPRLAAERVVCDPATSAGPTVSAAPVEVQRYPKVPAP